MGWQEQLISSYLIVCQEYESHLWKHCQRFTNNSSPTFTDQEVRTIYIYGIMEHLQTVKDIHRFTMNHLRSWFPTMRHMMLHLTLDYRFYALHLSI